MIEGKDGFDLLAFSLEEEDLPISEFLYYSFQPDSAHLFCAFFLLWTNEFSS